MRIDSSGATSFKGSSSLSTAVASIQHYSSNGYLYIKGGAGGLILGDDSTASRIQIEDNSNIRFETASSERMRITSAGNVGIGTTNPGAKLEVVGSSGAISGTGMTYLNNTDDAFSLVVNNAGNSSQNDRGVFEARVGTSSVFRINNSGNVGIGTTSPATKLHVNYTSGTGLTLSNTVANLYAEMRLQSANSSAYIFKSSNGYSAYGGINALNIFNEGQIAFHSSTVSNIMYLAAAGNVGIGTTSPQAKLHIGASLNSMPANTSIAMNGGTTLRFTGGGDGNSDYGAYIAGVTVGSIRTLQLGSRNLSTDELAMTLSQGKVGIGTTSPDEMLHIENSSGANIILNSNTGAVNNGIYMSEGLSSTPTINGAYFYYDSSANAVKLDTGTSSLSTKLTVLRDSGNVGIGTTGIGVNDRLIIKTSVDNDVAQGLVVQRSINTDEGYINYNGGGFQFRATDGDPIILGQLSNERVRIDSTGNVGIGTTSPSYKLDINGGTARITYAGYSGYEYHNTAGTWEVYIGTENNTGNARYNSRQGDHSWYANSTATMKLTSAGNLGIGTTAPTSASGTTLAIYNGSGQARLALKNFVTGDTSTDGFQLAIDGDGVAIIEQRENNHLSFSTNATARMRLTDDGNLIIGTITNAGYLLDVNGTARVVTLIETSALKYKTNIQPLGSQLSKVLQLQPVTFDWIDKPNPKPNIGLIADEVDKIYPEFVSKTENGDIEGIEYSKLTAVLIQSIKELNEIIANQQTQINTLLNK